MKLLFSDIDNDGKTSSGYVLDQEGGNPLLKDMAVPAGLFFLQRAFEEKKYDHSNQSSDDNTMPESLYNRLFSLVEDKATRKTKKQKKRSRGGKRMTKKNN